jgi:hypothetical protein
MIMQMVPFSRDFLSDYRRRNTKFTSSSTRIQRVQNYPYRQHRSYRHYSQQRADASRMIVSAGKPLSDPYLGPYTLLVCRLEHSDKRGRCFS